MARGRSRGAATVAALLLGARAASAAGNGPPTSTEVLFLPGVPQVLVGVSEGAGLSVLAATAREVVVHVPPVPLAAIHSTHDEFVPLREMQGILAQAREPRKLWIIEAANHRCSDNQPELRRRLKEAIGWI